MKFKEWRKFRPVCGEYPPPTPAFPHPRRFPSVTACRRLGGHRGRHAGAGHRWSK